MPRRTSGRSQVWIVLWGFFTATTSTLPFTEQASRWPSGDHATSVVLRTSFGATRRMSVPPPTSSSDTPNVDMGDPCTAASFEPRTARRVAGSGVSSTRTFW